MLKSIGKYALVDTNTLDQILHKGVKKITFDKHNIKKYKFWKVHIYKFSIFITIFNEDLRSRQKLLIIAEGWPTSLKREKVFNEKFKLKKMWL